MSNLNYATVLFVRNDEHGVQCLLQHKDRGHPDPKMKDVWTVFGGKIEPNENTEECIIREIGEELGSIVQAEHPIGTLSYFETIKIGEPGKEIDLTLFIAPFTSKLSDIRLGEGIGSSFFYLDNLPDNMLDHERNLIARFSAVADKYIV